MKTTRSTNLGVALAVALGGCGIERNIIEDFAGTARELPKPLGTTLIKGTHGQTGSAVVTATYASGAAIDGSRVIVDGASYTVDLPDGAYAAVLVTSTSGAVVLERIVPEVRAKVTTSGMALSVESTTVALAAQAAMAPWNESISETRGPGATKIITAFAKQTAAGGALAELNAAVQRVVDAAKAGGTAPSLQIPVLTATFDTERSAVNPDWLAGSAVDLDGDGSNDTTTAPFDALLSTAAKNEPLCKDPDYLRTLFMVNFNAGQKDGNCSTINRFKWVKDEPGKLMFFTGGIHKDSAQQDPVIQAEMGNWIPNIVKMYDDGTHGDQQSGDNIWTISFDLPKNLKTAYKYEWGKQGTSWTGSEEWPGNQRLLEIVDVNGDGFVYRYDNFGDEATNKDKVNGYYGGNGSVDWTTDANKNAIPDAGEQPVDLTNSCQAGAWTTPTWIGPAVSYCGQ